MPSVGKAAARAWRDLLAVFEKLPRLALIAFVIVVAVALGEAFWRATPTLVSILAQLVQAFLVTPYLIAVHRLIILGEVAPDYASGFRAPRFQRFFAWSVVFSAMWWAALSLASLPSGLPGVAVLVAVAFVALVVSLRMIVLFPAVAVDAPGARWQNAFADTKGHVWRIFLIFVVAGLPIFLADIVVLSTALSIGVLTSEPLLPEWSTVGGLLGGVAQFVYFTLAVVIASRLYESIGQRLKGAD